MLLKFLQQKHCLQFLFFYFFYGSLREMTYKKNCGTEKNVLSDH